MFMNENETRCQKQHLTEICVERNDLPSNTQKKMDKS